MKPKRNSQRKTILENIKGEKANTSILCLINHASIFGLAVISRLEVLEIEQKKQSKQDLRSTAIYGA